MKNSIRFLVFLVVTFGFSPLNSHAQRLSPIPLDRLGAVAGAQYPSDGLSIASMPDGARLHCAFQQLEGQVTSEGLWLGAPTGGLWGERFRVFAVQAGRGAAFWLPGDWLASGPFASIQDLLPSAGVVQVADNVARLIRHTLIEEYSVSMDGVRQDFVVTQPPGGDGELRVELDVFGAIAETVEDGVLLTLAGSGRKIAYSRLHVTDATGRQLSSRIDAFEKSRLTVSVDDAGASYPVRIDPTFSDADWTSMGGTPGADTRQVYSAAVDPAGNLYVGGEFVFIGEVYANRIAKWDGNSWTNLGSGMDEQVSSLAVFGGDLYAGGSFRKAGGISVNGIAKWDGTNWSALGSELSASLPSRPSVSALAPMGGDLVVGGFFDKAGGVVASNIAKWNGSAWTALGDGVNGPVFALTVAGSSLYAGGRFTVAGGNRSRGIAKWDGSAWSALESSLYDGVVYALASSGEEVFVGGVFYQVSELAGAYSVAKWNGQSWSKMGSGMRMAFIDRSSVQTLVVSGGNVFAGGEFDFAGGVAASHIAKWNGTKWSSVGSGVGPSANSAVYALAASGTNVYACGLFRSAGSVGVKSIAKWDGSNWSALGTGLNHLVRDVAVADNELYIGGPFTAVGDIQANGVAKWDGIRWKPLGSGIPPSDGFGYPHVSALAVSGSNLFVGGRFEMAGGAPASRIAKWNGIHWSALGSGIEGDFEGTQSWVQTIIASGEAVYVGGGFSAAGGIPAGSIAKWDANGWSALGSGVSYEVTALAFLHGDLYAGGTFSSAGGNPAENVAKWDGRNWSRLGEGVDGAVYSLGVQGDDLYVGGDFSIAGGKRAVSIAKWNGVAWSALEPGLASTVFPDGRIEAFEASGGQLYVGGLFRSYSTRRSVGIAKWDGRDWTELGSGIRDGTAGALAIFGPKLYVGGLFTSAGNKVSVNLAIANIGVAPGRFADAAYSHANGFHFTFLDASQGQDYRIQTSPSLVAGPWTEATNFVYTGPTVVADPSRDSHTNKYFRAITP